MWSYEKKLQYPIKIKNTNAQLAKFIASQYGGPDGELGASLRYLSQRFSMPDNVTKGILNDIGTEELAHLEMIGSIIYQLTRDLTPEEAKKQGFGDYYVDHSTAIYPVNASGVPFTASYFQSKGDVIADLTEDLAADGAIVYEQYKIVDMFLLDFRCQKIVCEYKVFVCKEKSLYAILNL